MIKTNLAIIKNACQRVVEFYFQKQAQDTCNCNCKKKVVDYYLDKEAQDTCNCNYKKKVVDYYLEKQALNETTDAEKEDKHIENRKDPKYKPPRKDRRHKKQLIPSDSTEGKDLRKDIGHNDPDMKKGRY